VSTPHCSIRGMRGFYDAVRWNRIIPGAATREKSTSSWFIARDENSGPFGSLESRRNTQFSEATFVCGAPICICALAAIASRAFNGLSCGKSEIGRVRFFQTLTGPNRKVRSVS
jgi:hypothetical protein